MSLSANALTTVAALETALSLSGTGTALEIFINAASDMIEGYVGRKLGRQTVTEYVKGYGTPLVHLERTPIESVTSVAEERGSSPALTQDTDFRIEDRDKGTLERIDSDWPDSADVELSASPHRRSGMERPSIKVVYVGGYALAGVARAHTSPTPAADAVVVDQPYDLELACIQLATHLYRFQGRSLGLTAKQVGNASEQYGAGSGSSTPAIPAPIMDMLDDYRRVR